MSSQFPMLFSILILPFFLQVFCTILPFFLSLLSRLFQFFSLFNILFLSFLSSYRCFVQFFLSFPFVLVIPALLLVKYLIVSFFTEKFHPIRSLLLQFFMSFRILILSFFSYVLHPILSFSYTSAITVLIVFKISLSFLSSLRCSSEMFPSLLSQLSQFFLLLNILNFLLH